MRIDAHQHFWQLARGDYGWLTPQAHPAIYQDFLPSHLKPLLKDARIEKTILVQAAPSEAETVFLLQLADATSFVGAVAGWVDFDLPNAAKAIARLAQNSKLRSLRPMLQDIPDDEWLLCPHVATAVDAVVAAGLKFDALVKPRHLPMLERFLHRHPDLPVVIDHGAKPDIRSGDLKTWAQAMRSIARAPNAWCKLSGLVTEAGTDWSTEMLRPYVDILLEVFGADRLMWGSDWPVLNEAADYLSWVRAAETMMRGLSERERQMVFGGTAADFYGVAS
jgi:L-fucono-1,5-lactonase